MSEARRVFNYRRMFRTPFTFQKFGNFTLAFEIPAVPAINFVGLVIICSVIWVKWKAIFPHELSVFDIFFIVGAPLLGAFLVSKINPDGKNIYVFLWGMLKYLFIIKIPKKCYCGDTQVWYKKETKIQFQKLAKVRGKHATRNAHEGNKKQYAIDENGRRVGVLPSQS